MGNIDWWVWAIIIVVVLVIAALVVRAGSARRLQHRRDKATTLREEASVAAVDARDREADAAAARAEAERARLEAERLDREAGEHEELATKAHDGVQERLTEADRLDPGPTPDPGAHRLDDDAAPEDR